METTTANQPTSNQPPRQQRAIARALRRLRREQRRRAAQAQLVPQGGSKPLLQPPVITVKMLPVKRKGGCGGCAAARKAMEERKKLREASMTKQEWLKAKADIERDIGLTEVKIVEHRNYKGPCRRCARRTHRMLEQRLKVLKTRVLEIDGEIASKFGSATAVTTAS